MFDGKKDAKFKREYAVQQRLDPAGERPSTSGTREHRQRDENGAQSVKTASRTMKVAFLALGSLGDCLPLCALAAALPAQSLLVDYVRGLQSEGEEQQQPDADAVCDRVDASGRRREMRKRRRTEPESYERPGGCGEEPFAATVVTHRSHCGLLAELMGNTFDVAEPPELCPIDLKILFPGASRQVDACPSTSNADSKDEEANAKERDSRVSDELNACMTALKRLQPQMLVFNLYSAFGYHLAEAMDIPCVCVSPGVAPSGGAVPLRRVLPRPVLERLAEGSDEDRDEITSPDLELWMLPLFLPHYHKWRLKHGLPNLAGFSDTDTLPRSCPILFGVSPAVLPRPGYWPRKAAVCGFWSFERLSPSYQPPTRLVRFLEAADRKEKPVFCVGLGSMPGLGFVRDPCELLSLVASCLLEAGVAVVLLPTPAFGNSSANGAAKLHTATAANHSQPCKKPQRVETRTQTSLDHDDSCKREMCSGPSSEDVLDLGVDDGETDAEVVPFVPHSWLLPRCGGLIHHGGSGTTGAALRAGVVQVVIPFAFDQFVFADKVEHMGIGSRVPGTLPPSSAQTNDDPFKAPKGVTREGVRVAIARAVSAEAQTSAQRYRAVVEEEHGIEEASKVLALEAKGKFSEVAR